MQAVRVVLQVLALELDSSKKSSLPILESRVASCEEKHRNRQFYFVNVSSLKPQESHDYGHA